MFSVKSLAEPNPTKPNLSKSAFRASNGITIGPVHYLPAMSSRNIALEKELTRLFALHIFAEASYIHNDVQLSKSKVHELAILTGPTALVGDTFFAVLFDKSGKNYRENQIFSNILGPILISTNETRGHRDIIYLAKQEETVQYRVFKFNGDCYQYWSESKRVKPGTILKGDVVFADQSKKTLRFKPWVR